MFFQDVAITFTSVYKFPKHKVSNFVLTKKGKKIPLKMDRCKKWTENE